MTECEHKRVNMSHSSDEEVLQLWSYDFLLHNITVII